MTSIGMTSVSDNSYNNHQGNNIQWYRVCQRARDVTQHLSVSATLEKDGASIERYCNAPS